MANKKVQLIYAFNGSGKTRLSREFKQLIAPKNDNGDADDAEAVELSRVIKYPVLQRLYWRFILLGQWFRVEDAEPKLNGSTQHALLTWVLKWTWDKIKISSLIFSTMRSARLSSLTSFNEVDTQSRVAKKQRKILPSRLFLK